MFVFDILSTLLGIIVLCVPQLTLLIDGANLVIFAIWFIVMGVISIINAVTVTKATGSGLWVLQLIFGILGILLGIFSFSQPLVSALTIGIMIGIYFIEVGITMIIAGAAAKQAYVKTPLAHRPHDHTDPTAERFKHIPPLCQLFRYHTYS